MSNLSLEVHGMSRLDDPIVLGKLACKNRIIRSATHSFLGSPDGKITDEEISMYETLAKNGVGLIITGHCCVAPGGRANEEQINVYDDSCIEGLRRAAETVHAHGAKFVVQLSHAGPRAIDTEDLADVTARELKKNRHAREMTVAEIRAVAKAFINAAVRVKQSGADGVQLHAAHSYLLSRFLDTTFNQRTDEYGGDKEGRFRIVEDIIRGIQEACGDDFPVLVKINCDSKTDDDAYERDLVYMLSRTKRMGVALVELSGVAFLDEPRDKHVYYLSRASRLRRVVEQPLSLVGGIRSLEDIERVLEDGIDMVSMSRAFVCEPDILPKLKAGESSQCLSCNRCFVIAHLHPGMRCVRQRKLMKK